MNAAVSRLSPTITTMIRMDHTHVLALFHRYRADTPAAKKRALVTNACIALDVHTQLEEEIFYPALRTVLTGDEALERSEPEHHEIRRYTSDLRQRLSGDGPFGDASDDEKLNELMRVVMHHIAEEETRLLPAAERLLADDLVRLGAEMTKRRIELLKPHAGELATSTVRSFPAGAAAGAALLTAGAVAIGAMLLRGRNDGRAGHERRWTPRH